MSEFAKRDVMKRSCAGLALALGIGFILMWVLTLLRSLASTTHILRLSNVYMALLMVETPAGRGRPRIQEVCQNRRPEQHETHQQQWRLRRICDRGVGKTYKESDQFVSGRRRGFGRQRSDASVVVQEPDTCRKEPQVSWIP